MQRSVVRVKSYVDEDIKPGSAESSDPKAVDPKLVEPKGDNPKADNPKGTEPKAGMPRATDPKTCRFRKMLARTLPIPNQSIPNQSIRKTASRSEQPGSAASARALWSLIPASFSPTCTSLPVAKRLTVTFADGMESEAVVIGTKPENDLAVLRAQKIPDDLPAASMGSSANLRPGDEVVAVGFPFGIGPSVSAGVVSGLGREFRSPEGQRVC